MIGIGIPILMAAIIGKCLIESGAAERIVRTFRGSMGENRDNATLLGTSYLLSIPVFFDNVFYVLTPIARAARAREGKVLLYLVAIIAGGSTAHALVPDAGPAGGIHRTRNRYRSVHDRRRSHCYSSSSRTRNSLRTVDGQADGHSASGCTWDNCRGPDPPN
ncbi:GntP family permease [Natrialba swarupiae]|nr:GntP family permease [Natrialba swarupiae]